MEMEIYGSKDDLCNESDGLEGHLSDENLGSVCGSADDNDKSPDNDSESLNQSLSSPGCLSALSGLQSPPITLASPLNLPITTCSTITITDDQPKQLESHINQATAEAAVVTHQSILQQHMLQQNNVMLCKNKVEHCTKSQHMPLSINFENSENNNNLCGNAPSLDTSFSRIPVLSSANHPSDTPHLKNDEKTTITNVVASSSLPEGMFSSLLSARSDVFLSKRLSQIHSNLSNAKNNKSSDIDILDKRELLSSNESTISNDSVGKNDGINHISPNTANLIGPQMTTYSVLFNSPIIAEPYRDKISVPMQRNPIGANPRDVNNPLSINQLTKRGDLSNISLSKNDNTGHTKNHLSTDKNCSINSKANCVKYDQHTNNSSNTLQSTSTVIESPTTSSQAMAFRSSKSRDFRDIVSTVLKNANGTSNLQPAPPLTTTVDLIETQKHQRFRQFQPHLPIYEHQHLCHSISHSRIDSNSHAHSLFNNSFNHHFQQQLGHHLAVAAVAAAMPSVKSNSNSNNNSHKIINNSSDINNTISNNDISNINNNSNGWSQTTNDISSISINDNQGADGQKLRTSSTECKNNNDPSINIGRQVIDTHPISNTSTTNTNESGAISVT